MTVTPLRVHHAAASDRGCVRLVNEDSYIARAEGLWAVADGMGGHADGQRASHLVAEALAKVTINSDLEASATRAAEAIHAANAAIYAEAAARGVRMGSTVVALLIGGRRFTVLWSGDSRAYLLRGGQMHRLTVDHSKVQEMVDRGLLSPDDAPSHPMAHVLSRAVGAEPTLRLDGVADAAQPRDVFLLCSDGVTGVVSDDELARLLGSGRPQAVVDAVLALCLERGAPDNVTLVLVACDEVTAVPQLSGGLPS